MPITKLFQSNRSQALRLPKAVEFPPGVREVVVRRVGQTRVIAPANANGTTFSIGPASTSATASSRSWKNSSDFEPAFHARHEPLHSCLRDRGQYSDQVQREADGLAISTVVLTELLHGAAKSARPVANRQAVNDFASRVALLAFDGAASRHAADIKAELERDGKPIGACDLPIAGHARNQGLAIVTSNLGEFRRVYGLIVED